MSAVVCPKCGLAYHVTDGHSRQQHFRQCSETVRVLTHGIKAMVA